MKAISKKTRFEVFKRDKFTCQYCGGKAPDIILHADHIEPKSKGGSNSLINLITSCVSCNLGKGARRLSDDTAVSKQHAQLAELQQRQEQLTMMMEWQRSLVGLADDTANEIAKFWSELSGYTLSETGERNIKRHVRKFGLESVLEAMRISSESYLRYDDQGDATQESVEIALKKIPGICTLREAEKEKPYLRDLYYIRAIVRNRCSHFLPHEATDWLDTAYSWGADTERLKSIACSATNWTKWTTAMVEYIKQLRAENPDA